MRRSTPRHLIRFISGLIVAAALVLSWPVFFSRRIQAPTTQAPASHAAIAKIVDGDTAELSNGRRVRYIGIDTPETSRRTSRGWEKVSEPYGALARRANEELALGRRVRLEYDVEPRDKYKRDLVYCFVDAAGGGEVMVQEELLRRGLAYLYAWPPNTKYIKRLAAAQEEAQSARRGIWSQDLTISVADAGRFIGQRKLVSGRIREARTTAKTIVFDMEGLSLVIFKSNLDLFLNEGIRPQDFYADSDVSVFGLIKEYRGAPEIIVSHPWQIDKVEKVING